ncbi:uncharacterized protein LOC107006523 [Solanum pennellii]|uniref:Uncharacterized protein LOC107006523 n=1 Tax=Solanum pennellii TaxID=28526 RepID=A0ABM1FR53_SOLPN|nr:uncharacterized protein LOC107006523 [Solanum pennellii]
MSKVIWLEPPEEGVPNAPEVQPQREVTNLELHKAIWMLRKAVTNQLKRDRAEDSPLASWACFEKAFLRRFFPREMKEVKVREFVILKRNSLSVHEYGLKFTQLSEYTSEMVVDMRSRISLFVSGLSRLSSKKGKVVTLIGNMDILRLMVYVQLVEER